MPNLLALLACADAHEGPWLRPSGREVGVRVYPKLGPGEEVVIDIERGGDSAGAEIASHHVLVGFTPLALADSIRFRARKLGSGTHTSVEVVSNGSTRSKNWDVDDPERRN